MELHPALPGTVMIYVTHVYHEGPSTPETEALQLQVLLETDSGKSTTTFSHRKPLPIGGTIDCASMFAEHAPAAPTILPKSALGFRLNRQTAFSVPENATALSSQVSRTKMSAFDGAADLTHALACRAWPEI